MADKSRQNGHLIGDYRETIRMPQEDKDMLDELAKDLGMKRSAAIRHLIRQAYKAMKADGRSTT